MAYCTLTLPSTFSQLHRPSSGSDGVVRQRDQACVPNSYWGSIVTPYDCDIPSNCLNQNESYFTGRERNGFSWRIHTILQDRDQLLALHHLRMARVHGQRIAQE